MHFVKMHGAGNDYVFVNCFVQKVEDPEALAPCISDRHTGVGSDGLILLMPSQTADARMRMFNADGSEAEMCGNGARCAARLLYDEGLVRRTELTLETGGGLRRVLLLLDGEGRVAGAEVEMGRPSVAEAPEAVATNGRSIAGLRVSIGNPHFVIFTDDVLGFPVAAAGPRIERSPLFPNRTNVEFAQLCNDGSILMRVWERGSGETMACGTGAVAAAAAAIATGSRPAGGTISVRLKGGVLGVRWDGETSAWLHGDAVEVFRGVWIRRGDAPPQTQPPRP